MVDFAALKNLYNQSMDQILGDTGLVVPCTLQFSNKGKDTVCPNCLFDPISRLSGYKYNGTGPVSFVDGTVCPVCEGQGIITGSAKSKTLKLAVIFDSKYFVNWSSSVGDIPDGAVQTICKMSLIEDIRNAQSMTVDTNISSYGNYSYSRAADPQPAGLGDHRYLITFWSRSP